MNINIATNFCHKISLIWVRSGVQTLVTNSTWHSITRTLVGCVILKLPERDLKFSDYF